MPDVYGPGRRADVDQLSKEDFIPVTEANKHGYWGYSPEADRDQYTVAGVTKDLDSTGRPKGAPDEKKQLEDTTAALKRSAK